MSESRLWPDIAIPPGELLAETLESLGMSQAELARRAGRPVQALNEIVRGSKEITPETALQLERVLGVPAHIWVRLEADYRCNLARLQDLKALEGEIPEAERYPYMEMAALGWVPRVKDLRQRALELMKFFRVSSLKNLELREPAVAWRKSPRINASPEALLAWLMRGEREAEGIEAAPFNKSLLQASLGELRGLTRQEREEFSPRLVGLLARCGIVLVFERHLPRTGVQGATQWLGQKAVIQLSVRYKWSDIFWFSLFHEVGHLLLHHKGVFVNPQAGEKSPQEREADHFATNELIPSARYRSFVREADIRSSNAVIAFAKEVGVAPSIVVGRLQHDKQLPYSGLNGLRTRFEIVEK
jgi:HTH-type transcriptional regulator/antitoxin HigA